MSSKLGEPVAAAAMRRLIHELTIIMLAAHRMAGGHGLAWSDYERLHVAHQHVIAVLSELTGREVLTA